MKLIHVCILATINIFVIAVYYVALFKHQQSHRVLEECAASIFRMEKEAEHRKGGTDIGRRNTGTGTAYTLRAY
jgi:hypothetical protein